MLAEWAFYSTMQSCVKNDQPLCFSLNPERTLTSVHFLNCETEYSEMFFHAHFETWLKTIEPFIVNGGGTLKVRKIYFCPALQKKMFNYF